MLSTSSVSEACSIARSSRSEARAIDGQRRSRGSAITISRSGTSPSRSARHCITWPASATGAPVRSATTARSRAAGSSGAAATSAASSAGTPASLQPRRALREGRPPRCRAASRAAPPAPRRPARRTDPARRPAAAPAPRRAPAGAAASGRPARPAASPRCAAPPASVGGDLVVQRPDGVPQPVDVEDRPGDGVRQHHPVQRHPGLLDQPEQPGHPGDVDRAVGQRGRHDLPPQRVRSVIAAGKRSRSWAGK